MMRRPDEKKPDPKEEAQRRKEAREAFESRKILECYGEARFIRERHGDPYLAMNSKPAEHGCVECSEDYIPRGISIDNPFLRHVHFSQADLDRDPALELAIVEAKKATHHPLEASAKPRSPEAWAKMFAALRDKLAQKMTPQNFPLQSAPSSD